MAEKHTRPAARVLGLTGPIASGKTTVGDLLLELGASERIDADQEVHALMTPGTPTTERILTEFGPEVLLPDGGIDRQQLGRIVFADPDALRRLEHIVHPAVREAIRKRISSHENDHGVIVVDAVKLLQSDLLPLCDAVWVVETTPDEQMRRLIKVRGMTPREAQGRLQAQPAYDNPRVTGIINNSGNLDDLRLAVTAAWNNLRQ